MAVRQWFPIEARLLGAGNTTLLQRDRVSCHNDKQCTSVTISEDCEENQVLTNERVTVCTVFGREKSDSTDATDRRIRGKDVCQVCKPGVRIVLMFR